MDFRTMADLKKRRNDHDSRQENDKWWTVNGERWLIDNITDHKHRESTEKRRPCSASDASQAAYLRYSTAEARAMGKRLHMQARKLIAAWGNFCSLGGCSRQRIAGMVGGLGGGIGSGWSMDGSGICEWEWLWLTLHATMVWWWTFSACRRIWRGCYDLSRFQIWPKAMMNEVWSMRNENWALSMKHEAWSMRHEAWSLKPEAWSTKHKARSEWKTNWEDLDGGFYHHWPPTNKYRNRSYTLERPGSLQSTEVGYLPTNQC